MNREILFRGKRVDNGEWVEGYYTELPIGSLAATIFSNDDEIVCEDTASYIISVFTKQHSNYSNSCPLEAVECEKYEIAPETIGQYTGLTDRNGVKIFEGDIIKGKGGIVYAVEYSQNIAGYISRGFGVLSRPCMNIGTMKYYEAIGNIHDNYCRKCGQKLDWRTDNG